MVDMIGGTYGYLTVVGRAPNNKHRSACWLCLCKCGEHRIVVGKSLRRGHVTSCGCKRSAYHPKGVEIEQSERVKEHHLYVTWQGIRKRCCSSNSKDYKNYGGRGIHCSDAWDSFRVFVEDMGDSWQIGLSIDRIDNDLGYSKENCKWSTPSEQSRNTRRNKMVEYQGEVKCLVDWCETLKLNYRRIKDRIGRQGWSITKAFETLNKQEGRHETTR